MSLNPSILTLITFAPAVGALVLMLFPRGAAQGAHDGHPVYGNDRLMKWVALLVSLLAFAFSLHLPYHFDHAQTGFQRQFEVNAIWIESPNIRYHLGVDGISMWLVILTTLLVPLSIISSWKSIHGRVKEFMVLMLLLETSMMMVRGGWML